MIGRNYPAGHVVITGGWLTRTADGASWDGYRVARLDTGDVFTYSGPGLEHLAALESARSAVESDGSGYVWHAGTWRTPAGHTVPAYRTESGAHHVEILPGDSDRTDAAGHTWRVEYPWNTGHRNSGHAASLHAAMSAAADWVRYVESGGLELESADHHHTS